MALESKFTPLSVVVAASGATLALPYFFDAPRHFTASAEIPPIIAGFVSLGAGVLIAYCAWKTLYLSMRDIRVITLIGVVSLVGAIVSMVYFDKFPYPTNTVGRSIAQGQILIQLAAAILTSVGGLKLSFGPGQTKKKINQVD